MIYMLLVQSALMPRVPLRCSTIVCAERPPKAARTSTPNVESAGVADAVVWWCHPHRKSKSKVKPRSQTGIPPQIYEIMRARVHRSETSTGSSLLRRLAGALALELCLEAAEAGPQQVLRLPMASNSAGVSSAGACAGGSARSQTCGRGGCIACALSGSPLLCPPCRVSRPSQRTASPSPRASP